MIVWFALLIPVLAVIYLNYKHSQRLIWWEFFIPIIAVLFTIILAKASFETVLTNDTEWWTGYVVKAQYYEDWDEYISQTCSTTDSEGRTTTYDCSYVLYHPAEYYIIDNNDITISIDQHEWNSLSAKFNNATFIDMHRWYYWNDGDLYESYYDNNDKHLTVVTTQHSYENRVANSASIFNYPSINYNNVKVFNYPNNSELETPSVLCNVPLSTFAYLNHDLCKMNALLGKSKKIRTWLLIWGNENNTLQDGLNQEAYWKNGNKNELVICVGINDNKVTWCHVFGWPKEEEVKIVTRNLFLEKLLTSNIINDLSSVISDHWQYRGFKEFSYIRVEPPIWFVFMLYLFSILVTLGTCYWVINNEFE